ncbi:HPr family phosphocarrier protein [Streptomyces sp. AC495_CC817]|uniref:HPr family phosphocarrier protein n=1 Tax=Streptomyces sp. AC495_CC817 TaxID=2823900 RepID=UPI001C26BE40|nr:HPr family phosphocarrier protein [Streptomyces sp. AC495_CC817]
MATRKVRITAHNGAHARPVAELARLAMAHDGRVIVRTAAGAEADLTSVLAVMDLALAEGDVVALEAADGPASEALLDALVEVLAPRSR